MTEEDVRNRIKKVLEEYKSSKRSLSNGDTALERRLQRQIRTPSLDTEEKLPKIGTSTILAFLEAYPDISAEWLLRGTGNMLSKSSKDATDNERAKCFNESKDYSNFTKKQLIDRVVELESDKNDLKDYIKVLKGGIVPQAFAETA